MTPYEIEMILYFNGHVNPWPQQDAPAFMEAIRMFQGADLIEVPTNIDRPKLTARGRAYVTFLCMLPLPMATWGIPGPLQFALPEDGV